MHIGLSKAWEKTVFREQYIYEYSPGVSGVVFQEMQCSVTGKETHFSNARQDWWCMPWERPCVCCQRFRLGSCGTYSVMGPVAQRGQTGPLIIRAET